jgi:hypothetical protein
VSGLARSHILRTNKNLSYHNVYLSCSLVLALADSPDILAAIMTTTFELESELAEHLERLCGITNLGTGELINTLLADPLRQIIEDGDAHLLQRYIQPFVYATKEEALETIARYKRFVPEGDASVYHYDVAPRRTREGDWDPVPVNPPLGRRRSHLPMTSALNAKRL